MLDRYSLFEAELQCFNHSLPLYIKQKAQQAVQFEVRMGPDLPLSYSRSQVAFKFLFIDRILKKGGLIGNN